MSKPTDIQIKQAVSSTEQIDYRTPIKFGGRVVNDVVLFNVAVEVETRDGRQARGTGSMPVGNVWGWPTDAVPGDQTLAAMVKLGERLTQAANNYAESAHPLEITHYLGQSYATTADEVIAELNAAEQMPRLAQLVSASPIEAAIHDHVFPEDGHLT